jgi:hypothetical protein
MVGLNNARGSCPREGVFAKKKSLAYQNSIKKLEGKSVDTLDTVAR